MVKVTGTNVCKQPLEPSTQKAVPARDCVSLRHWLDY